MPGIAVNRAFGAQRITGQQRYATEISSRLLRMDRVRALDVPPGVARSAVATWGWAQTLGRSLRREEVLLSLTSRAPVVQRRHVVVVHDLFVLTHPEWFTPLYVRTHAPALRAQLRTADALVAVSRPVADEVRDAVDDRVPVAVAPNAGDSASVAAVDGDGSAAPVREPLPGVPVGSYLLTVGSVDPRKNLRLLAEAYGNLPRALRADHPLVVVGGSGASFGRHHIEWPEGAVLPGYLSDRELGRLYRGAAAVVVPSLDEGFGLPLLEAAAARVPVVLSDIPVFRWVYGDGATYVDPHDADDLTAALHAAVAGPVPTAGELAAKARALGERFTWKDSADRVHRFVRGLGG